MSHHNVTTTSKSTTISHIMPHYWEAAMSITWVPGFLNDWQKLQLRKHIREEHELLVFFFMTCIMEHGNWGHMQRPKMGWNDYNRHTQRPNGIFQFKTHLLLAPWNIVHRTQDSETCSDGTSFLFCNFHKNYVNGSFYNIFQRQSSI